MEIKKNGDDHIDLAGEGLSGNSHRLPPQTNAEEKKYNIFELRNIRKLFGKDRDSELRVDGVERRVKDRAAHIDGAEIPRLNIPAGKMIAILGGSGSGKTTLLSLLGQLSAPDAERRQVSDMDERPQLLFNVRRDGCMSSQDLYASGRWGILKRLFQRNLIHKEIGFVFQEAHLLRNAPVSLNFAVSLATAGKLARRPREMISEMAQLLEGEVETQKNKHNGLAGKLAARARVLSGGQAQRVALGRAVIRDPAVVLADEPTASLDSMRGFQIMALLYKWQKEGPRETPRSVIWVTHDVAQAAMFADQIIVLRGGRLLDWMDGRPAENPRDINLLYHWLTTGEQGEGPDVTRQKDTLKWQLSLEKSIADRSLSLMQPAVNEGERGDAKKRFSAPSVLWRLAISEVFSKDGSGVVSHWLKRMISVGKDGSFEVKEKRKKKTDWGRIVTMLLAVGVMSALSYFDFGKEAYITELWGRILIILSVFGFLASVFWGLVHSFSKKVDVLTYLMLFLFFAVALKGATMVEDVFSARMASPELSHVVIEADDPALLNDKTLIQLDTILEKEFSPTSSSPVRPWSQRKNKRVSTFAFGRMQEDVDVGKVHWPTDDANLQFEKICPKSERMIFNSVEALAVNMAEPFVSRIKHFSGPSLKKLNTGLYQPRQLEQGSGIFEVYITLKFARKLYRRLGHSEDTPLKQHSHFCLRILDTYKPVKIAGIVDRIPGDRGAKFQILTTTRHLQAALRASKIKRKGYRTAAIYLDPKRVGDFVDRIGAFAAKGVSVRVGRGRKSRRAKLTFETENGLAKITEALKLGQFFQVVTQGTVLIIMFLAAVITGIISRNYIIQNERSLCVMRAFGIGTLRILRMMLMQFTILLLPVFALIGALGYMVWPVVVADVGPLLGVTSSKLALTINEGLLIAGIFVTLVFGGCFVAMTFWWQSSRWIAERLKEIS